MRNSDWSSDVSSSDLMADHLMEFGGVGFIQIDCGRIGGIGPAKQVADRAVERGITYVNHTFTSNLDLSASLQPFAGLAEHRICEYTAAHPQQIRRTSCRARGRQSVLIYVVV